MTAVIISVLSAALVANVVVFVSRVRNSKQTTARCERIEHLQEEQHQALLRHDDARYDETTQEISDLMAAAC